ncbi:hypothetical protein [Paraconexibacter algicola]|uniref:DUF916 domain-containing protein n=1 Tax=Paraconexibacter algicola TaxID=2133960 RepID=A0A2T4UD79_9ACTN|nr:hypothetical protein [Paraconexibacter algicola]PTL55460.1 hypothetical protein C7Y72_17550 [Paraconexibacter algicola]
MHRRQLLTGLAGVAFVLPLALGRQDAGAASGLTLSPSVIERQATSGRVGQITITNGLSRTVDVRVAARPWLQARTGAVTPDRRRTLSGIKLSTRTFAMPARSSRTVRVDLSKVPTAGSLYGNVEFVATPRGQKKGQVKVSYRLIGALRLNPSATRRRLALQGGQVAVRSRQLQLAVRNAGNTATPVTGDFRLTNAAGSRAGSIQAVRVLPGYAVDVPLTTTRGLARGKYTLTVRLTQGSRVVTTVKRQVVVGG